MHHYWMRNHFIDRMKIEQKSWTKDAGWVDISKEKLSMSPQLVLMFAGRQLLEEGERFKEVRALYPDSHILTCSTAGGIIATQGRDNSVALTAGFFEKTTVKFTPASIKAK